MKTIKMGEDEIAADGEVDVERHDLRRITRRRGFTLSESGFSVHNDSLLCFFTICFHDFQSRFSWDKKDKTLRFANKLMIIF